MHSLEIIRNHLIESGYRPEDLDEEFLQKVIRKLGEKESESTLCKISNNEFIDDYASKPSDDGDISPFSVQRTPPYRKTPKSRELRTDKARSIKSKRRLAGTLDAIDERPLSSHRKKTPIRPTSSRYSVRSRPSSASSRPTSTSLSTSREIAVASLYLSPDALSADKEISPRKEESLSVEEVSPLPPSKSSKIYKPQTQFSSEYLPFSGTRKPTLRRRPQSATARSSRFSHSLSARMKRKTDPVANYHKYSSMWKSQKRLK
ncbi:hypothetical protein ADUPG1_009206 [Aduncisulcus paluster]|uniref:Uncharacterized protein n=1 Tax=Aduncisulcus paluster TaxID=2918883 RepID=A0ABQ5KW01_9EUKA|nr:hypothetical protein ADUPG1_009206 [Aduncisulcus paluster]|eukprot:gnl/Carplike_NY0171/12055_a17322_128.p1 GENE.gnl/Carplike_NY0171/12055_a17322_128~~gnl/Carplike_NY0171/12055_a17322_128.p1  ORF type:complete len:261 (-),score=38.42 gnl/Carplike_NY0171/12055_a17322_128:20-802(-)